jgi:hypothetical protein
MTRHVLPAKLKRVRKSLFVRAHECGKLLLGQTRQLPSSTAGPIESHQQEGIWLRTFMKNSPSSESIFTGGDASACGILRSEGM